MALQVNGTVWTWGYNEDGQLGDGTTIDNRYPMPVEGVEGATCIAAGYDHAVAGTWDGSIYNWGDNTLGQLGDGTTTSSPVPVRVLGPGAVTAVAAGASHSLALSAGAMMGWGQDGSGELGQPPSNTPRVVLFRWRVPPAKITG